MVWISLSPHSLQRHPGQHNLVFLTLHHHVIERLCGLVNFIIIARLELACAHIEPEDLNCAGLTKSVASGDSLELYKRIPVRRNEIHLGELLEIETLRTRLHLKNEHIQLAVWSAWRLASVLHTHLQTLAGQLVLDVVHLAVIGAEDELLGWDTGST